MYGTWTDLYGYETEPRLVQINYPGGHPGAEPLLQMEEKRKNSPRLESEISSATVLLFGSWCLWVVCRQTDAGNSRDSALQVKCPWETSTRARSVILLGGHNKCRPGLRWKWSLTLDLVGYDKQPMSTKMDPKVRRAGIGRPGAEHTCPAEAGQTCACVWHRALARTDSLIFVSLR